MSKKGNAGKFILGAGIGASLALLFAPKKGSELREDLKNKLDDLVNKAKDIDLHQQMNRATSMAYATLTGATVKIVSNHDNHLNSSVSKLVDILNL